MAASNLLDYKSSKTEITGTQVARGEQLIEAVQWYRNLVGSNCHKSAQAQTKLGHGTSGSVDTERKKVGGSNLIIRAAQGW